jgi:hypothetical protein
MKKLLKYTGYTLLTLVGLILIYLGCAWTFSHLTIKGEKQQNPDVTVYILGNGIHTDVVVPVKTAYKDWSQGILYKNTRGNDTSLQYLAIGWGDKDFYLKTPHLADLTFSTAFNAAFGLSSSAMHTTFYKSLFHTCNTWTNNALKACGQKACWWTPFEDGVFYAYKK